MTNEEKAQKVADILTGEIYLCRECNEYVHKNNGHYHYYFEYVSLYGKDADNG